MKKYIFILFLLFCGIQNAFAGLFSMDSKGQEAPNNQEQKTREIQVLDSVGKLIQKRREEAYKLISEGAKLIKKGKKKNNQSLIVKGKIKKEIGEKQLQVLKEQSEYKKKEDESYGW